MTSTTDRALPVTALVPNARPVLAGALTALAAIVAIALPASALAQTTTTETGSGYSATPTLSTSTTTSAHSEARPAHEEEAEKPTQSKHATKPKTEEEKPAVTPAPKEEATKPTKAKSLPFTGLNLIWVIGGGLLLLGAGVTIRIAQRRHG